MRLPMCVVALSHKCSGQPSNLTHLGGQVPTRGVGVHTHIIPSRGLGVHTLPSHTQQHTLSHHTHSCTHSHITHTAAHTLPSHTQQHTLSHHTQQHTHCMSTLSPWPALLHSKPN